MLDNQSFTLRPDIVVTVVDDSAVLLDLDSKYFYSVNAPGWAIVQMLEAGAPEEGILARCRAWGCDPESDKAITGFLAEFRDHGLVVAGGQGEAGEVSWNGPWCDPVIEKHKEPLQRVMVSAFDPSLPLAE